jgi:3-deoxy-D-manno-octulosonic-acid transferase
VKYLFALLIYRFLLLLFLPFILVFFVIRSRKNPLFRHRLTERLGFINKNLQKGGIVVHAASVGEVIALKNFIEQLIIAYPTLPITLTTFTPTGSAQVAKLFPQHLANKTLQHCYLPLDITPCTALFLKRLQPKAMVFMETELWPNIIAQAVKRQTRLLLINGRLSAHSMRSYQKIRALIAPTLNHFDQILVQSQDNLDNFIQLGAEENRCLLAGNIKFDIAINNDVLAKKHQLEAFLPKNRQLWVFASTHQGDEVLALASFKKLQQQFPDLLLVIVPRHPERFNEVANLCLKQGFSLARRSKQQTITDDTHVWLLDSLGELMATYALAELVTMGGSFSDIGGHNPLEPALFKKPIIVGPRMDNFVEIEQQLLELEGVVKIPSIESDVLAQMVSRLLTDKDQQKQLGDNAFNVVTMNQGASKRCLSALQNLVVSPVDDQELIAQQTDPINSRKTDLYCVYNKSLVENFNAEMLTPDYWHNQQAITGSAQGRGTTWFIAAQNQQWVLRHYYRGGLIGKLIKDSYWFTQMDQTRAAKEYQLLNMMNHWQLPTPKGVAYKVQQKGLFYQADLLSSRIKNAQDLVAILSTQSLCDDVWQNIGVTIKRFHQQGIYHHDLNSHNILLDNKDKVWLIDFDRGELRKISSQWQQANMQRLLRSFHKEKAKLATFHWHEKHWQILMKGYNL